MKSLFKTRTQNVIVSLCLGASALLGCEVDPTQENVPSEAAIEAELEAIDGKADGAGNTVKVWGLLANYATLAPAAGVVMCLVRDGADYPCTQTAADGTFELAGLPRNKPIEIAFRGGGAANSSTYMRLKNDYFWKAGILTQDLLNQAIALHGGTPGDGQGLIGEIAFKKQADGSYAPMAGASWKAIPHTFDFKYNNTPMTVDPNLTETTTAGFGTATSLANPGKYFITGDYPSNVNCINPGEHILQGLFVTVRPNYFTGIYTHCE